MWHSERSAVLAVIAVIAATGLSGCGNIVASNPAAGQSDSIAVSLKTVPTIRSVTVSPGKARFGTCGHGQAATNTKSTPNALGFPNGTCLVGMMDVSYPITVANTGIASSIDVSGSNAVPSDGGTQWSLCNAGAHPVVACTNGGGSSPGLNQYAVLNFAQDRRMNQTGLTDTPTCDATFSQAGGCWAVEGQSQSEGLELIGPASSDDISTSWTVTITWTPVPR